MLTIEEQISCKTNRKALYEHGGRMGRKDGLRQHYEQTEGKGVSAVSLGLAMLLLAACTSAGTGPMPVNLASLPDGSIPNSPSEMAQARVYLIQPGDELSIKFYFSPELNEEHLIVRPDGNISLQLVHEVRAAGHTPMELTRILTKKYATQLNRPEIAVIVRSVKAPNKIYVGGKVVEPGEFEMVGSITVLQAIALARGMQDTANKTKVLVIRRNGGVEPSVIRLNLKAALVGDDLTQDIPLLPHDFVYVPESFW